MTQPKSAPIRRRHRRVRVDFDADVWVDRGFKTIHIHGRLVVLGEGGAFLELGESYAIGSVLRIRFTVAELGEITCRAIIRYGLEGKGVGTEFLDMDLHEHARIKTLVEKTMSNT